MAYNNESTFKRAFFELYWTMKIIPSRLVWVRLQKIVSGELSKSYPKTSKILSKNIPQISKKSSKIIGLVESRIIRMDSSLLWRVMADLWSSCSFLLFLSLPDVLHFADFSHSPQKEGNCLITGYVMPTSSTDLLLKVTGCICFLFIMGQIAIAQCRRFTTSTRILQFVFFSCVNKGYCFLNLSGKQRQNEFW